jgi:hypothetical protein
VKLAKFSSLPDENDPEFCKMLFVCKPDKNRRVPFSTEKELSVVEAKGSTEIMKRNDILLILHICICFYYFFLYRLVCLEDSQIAGHFASLFLSSIRKPGKHLLLKSILGHLPFVLRLTCIALLIESCCHDLSYR